MSREAVFKLVVLGWLGILTLGIMIAGWGIWSGRLLLPSSVITEVTQAAVENTQPASNSSLTAQVASLSSQVQQLQIQLSQLNNNAATKPSSAAAPSSSAPSSAGPAREFYLPMGYGSTPNRDWTPITGAQVTFDPSKYQPIQALYFEAAGSIISGEVHVMLTDLTHNVTYYNTELVFNSSSPEWQRSQAIPIPTSVSTMQVQIQSSNGEMAVLNDSRLVVVTGP